MRRLVPALVMAAALGACGGAGDGRNGAAAPRAGAGCGPARQEPLDPGSAHHLLAGAPEPTYMGDPPTSGAHLA
ncbi:MAG: hypothetical protein M3N31_04270, partial [Actinomycetota bacterium]|nr:hypothetical protein [Actinomycetota bacterium]